MLDKAPNGKVSDLLNALDKALSAGEVERAVDLFQADCYWRDLVTFTWNIKTMEGKERFATCSRRGSPIRSRRTGKLRTVRMLPKRMELQRAGYNSKQTSPAALATCA